MDDLACSDLRLGVMARVEFERESRWGTYRRKDGTGTPSSFCETLIQDAGGFRRFIEDYELEPEVRG